MLLTHTGFCKSNVAILLAIINEVLYIMKYNGINSNIIFIERQDVKAAQISEYGDPSVIHISDIPTPKPGPGQVLVEVHGSSLNPADTGLRNGAMQKFIPLQLPVTLGGDIAGVVKEVGEGVSNLKPGDKVYGQAYAVFGDSGAYAEYAVTEAERLGSMPKNIDFTVAGALPLVGVSAVEALIENIQLQPGQKILIHGGAGSIGQLAIQLAKQLGAYVATTVAGKDVERAKQLGADEVFNYQADDFAQSLSGYDAVLDLAAGKTSAAGSDVFSRSLKVLKPGGTIVSLVAYAGSDALQRAQQQGFTALFQQTNVSTRFLDMLTHYVEDGTLTFTVAKTFPLDDIQQAFELLETDSPGKIAIQIKE